jgi:hypothetical protein
MNIGNRTRRGVGLLKRLLHGEQPIRGLVQ